jgi:hypothetical protein
MASKKISELPVNFKTLPVSAFLVGNLNNVTYSFPVSTLPFNTNIGALCLPLSGGRVNGNITTNNLSALQLVYDQYGNSLQWNSVYTQVKSSSASWNSSAGAIQYANANFLPLTGGRLTGNTQINADLTVYGTISATGNSYFSNTIYSTTSALSVVNVGNNGPALYVANTGSGDIASFYDLDENKEILHIGGHDGDYPNVGIKTSSPNKDLTVNGEISAYGSIWTSGDFISGGREIFSIIYPDINKGLSVYTSVNTASANWDSNQANFLPLSGGTLNGKLNLSSTAIKAGLNIGQSVSLATPYEIGDLWRNSSGRISYALSTNTAATVAELERANSYTQSQTITNNNNTSPALRITQTGLANAILVEDDTHPDSTPFVIDNLGSVGIGLSSIPNINAKLTVIGNVSATGSYFGDGSQLTGIVAGVYCFGAGTNAIQPVNGDNTASGCFSNVAGGQNNTASGGNSTVGGGRCNTASNDCTSVVGGVSNNASGFYSSVVGGNNNTASGNNSTVGGGFCNTASNDFTNVVGGCCNTASGAYSTISGGYYNSVGSGGNFSNISGGAFNTVCEQYSNVSGGRGNTSCGFASSTASGYYNTASNNYSTVSGGYKNTSSGYASMIGAGRCNTADNDYSSVVGGSCNTASGHYSIVGGGMCNISSGCGSNVSGGICNTAVYFSTVSGGYQNSASGNGSSIGGGEYNNASENNSNVAGGYNNTASGYASNVAGGCNNTASGIYSNVAGGGSNTASGNYSNVAGGISNTASLCNSNVAGGYNNTASGYTSNVAGGEGNTASGCYSNVAGGYRNTASNTCSTISGGYCNTASGNGSSIGGGQFNTASGDCSSILGGNNNNTNNQSNTFILGSSITASQQNYTYVNNLSSQGNIISNTLQASVKNFVIKHPIDNSKSLQYSSLESPYIGVRLTGEDKIINGECVVTLPDYIKGLIHEEDVHILLTNYKHYNVIYVDEIDIENNIFLVKSENCIEGKEYKFFWSLTGVRKDVPKLQVEI